MKLYQTTTTDMPKRSITKQISYVAPTVAGNPATKITAEITIVLPPKGM